MQLKLTMTFGHLLRILLLIGTLAAVAAQGMFAYKFGFGDNWLTLSGNPEMWGVYGDFIGGTLNPIFSFLAFVGIVFTVLLQARQLDTIRAQSGLEELQRVLASVSARIEDHLRANIKVQPMATESQMHEVLAEWGTSEMAALAGEMDRNVYGMTPTDRQNTIQRIRLLTWQLATELESLAWALDQYLSAGGGAVIVEFYKRRYQTLTIWLEVLGALHHGLAAKHVHEVFTPRKVLEGMRSTPEERAA